MDSGLSKVLATLAVAVGLALGGCGGDDSSAQRTTPTWQPDERLPAMSQRWWWEPVEQPCEEDSDCPDGQRCQLMRLSTCPECPPGELAEICVPRQQGNAQASNR